MQIFQAGKVCCVYYVGCRDELATIHLSTKNSTPLPMLPSVSIKRLLGTGRVTTCGCTASSLPVELLSRKPKEILLGTLPRQSSIQLMRKACGDDQSFHLNDNWRKISRSFYLTHAFVNGNSSKIALRRDKDKAIGTISCLPTSGPAVVSPTR